MIALDPADVASDRPRGTKMVRGIFGVVAGLAVWVVLVSIGGLMIRLSWPTYASVEAAMAFTLPMLIARLSISAVATLGAGLVTAVIAPRSMRALLMSGVILLVAFVPVHLGLWDKFPVWYHLTFLLSLVPLIYLGGRITWRESVFGLAMTAVPGIQR
jgi:hypothetical protein